MGQARRIFALLIDDLESADANRQQWACAIAGRLGPTAAPVLPKLERLHTSADDELGAHTAGAIHAITGRNIRSREGARY